MYVDTAVVVKLVVREPDSSHWAALVDGQVLWSSEVMLTECFSALLRKQREGAISAAHRTRAWRRIEDDIARARLSLVPLSADLLRAANVVLEKCHPAVPLRSLDAVHLASAQHRQSWPLATSDGRMRQAATLLGLRLSPLA